MNNKAQLACKTVFQLVHNHGDILRDGWKNILDCIIQLYKAKLLPKVLIEVYLKLRILSFVLTRIRRILRVFFIKIFGKFLISSL